MWQPAPWQHCMKIVIFRLLHLCDGLLYRIALIADFLLNSMHRTIHTTLKQNYRYIISNNNYKYYKSHAKSDMYLKKSKYSVSSQSLHIMWFSLLCSCHVEITTGYRHPANKILAVWQPTRVTTIPGVPYMNNIMSALWYGYVNR